MAPWWAACVPLTLFAVLLAACWWRWRRHSTHFSRLGVPCVLPLPFVGNMLPVVLGRQALCQVVLDLYRRLQANTYAGVFYFRRPVVMINDPEVIRAVIVKDFNHFTDHLPFGVSQEANPLFKKMLFCLTGKEWYNTRTTLTPAFTSLKIKNMFVLISEIGQQMLDHMLREATEAEDGSVTIEMKEFFTRVCNDVIASTAFGFGVNSLLNPDNEFYRMGHDLTNFSGVRTLVALGYMISPKIMEFLHIPFFHPKTEGFFRSLVSETIRVRQEQNTKRQDLIQILMEISRDEHKPDDDKGLDNKTTSFGEDDVAAQAMSFFFAGFETVATLLTFCSYLLATHEDVQFRLRKEVDDVMSSSGGQPTYEQVTGCQYLDMVVTAQRFALLETKVLLLYLMSHFRLQVDPRTTVPLELDPKNFGLNIKGGAWLCLRRRK